MTIITTTSRRAILAGAGALPALAVPTALAAPSGRLLTGGLASDDRTLVTLGEKLLSAMRIEHEADAADRLDNNPISDLAVERAYQACSAIVDEIEGLHASTLEGLGVKALAISWCHNSETPIEFTDSQMTDVRLAQSIVMDLLRGATVRS